MQLPFFHLGSPQERKQAKLHPWLIVAASSYGHNNGGWWGRPPVRRWSLDILALPILLQGQAVRLWAGGSSTAPRIGSALADDRDGRYVGAKGRKLPNYLRQLQLEMKL
jgi:hypothetical protein